MLLTQRHAIPEQERRGVAPLSAKDPLGRSKRCAVEMQATTRRIACYSKGLNLNLGRRAHYHFFFEIPDKGKPAAEGRQLHLGALSEYTHVEFPQGIRFLALISCVRRRLGDTSQFANERLRQSFLPNSAHRDDNDSMLGTPP